MPLFPYTSDWPGALKVLLGILVFSVALAVADLIAKLLLRMAAVRELSVQARKTIGVVGVFLAGIAGIVAGLHEQHAILLSTMLAGMVSVLFAARAGN